VRFFFHLGLGTFVTTLGSTLPTALLADFRRRDSEEVEIMFIRGEQGEAAPVQLPGTPEIHFGGKATGRYGDDLIVGESAFAWWPTEQVYVGRPSFGTVQMNAQFLGSAGVPLWLRSGSAYTATSTELAGLIVLSHTTDCTLTLPTGLGQTGSLLYVMAGGEGVVTVAAANGVTLTGDVLAASGQRIIQLTRQATADTWLATIPTERAVVELMGEFTWRDTAVPAKWTSSPQFRLIIANDVIRGDEGAPQDPNAAAEFVTRGELDADLTHVLLSTEQTLTTNEKAQARTNIGAAAESALTTAQADIDALETAMATKATTTALSAASATAASATAAVDTRVTSLDAVVLKKTQQTFTDPEIDRVRENLKLPLLGASAGSADPERRERLFWTAAAGSTTPTTLGITTTVLGGTATARSIDLTDAGRAVTYTSTQQINLTAHGLAAGTAVQMAAGAGGTLAAGYTAGVWYYVNVISANAISLQDANNSIISRTSAGTGTQLLKYVDPAAWALPRVRRLGYVSAATANSMAGIRHARQEWARSTVQHLGGWTFEARFAISDAADVADARLFVGMASMVPAFAGNLVLATMRDSIGFASNASGVGQSLRIFSIGSSTQISSVDLGANFPHTRGIMYRVKLVCATDGTVQYEVTRIGTAHVATGTVSTNLPRSHALLTPALYRGNGSTALAVALDIAEFSVQPTE
jgi:hypothetical protein